MKHFIANSYSVLSCMAWSSTLMALIFICSCGGYGCYDLLVFTLISPFVCEPAGKGEPGHHRDNHILSSKLSDIMRSKGLVDHRNSYPERRYDWFRLSVPPCIPNTSYLRKHILTYISSCRFMRCHSFAHLIKITKNICYQLKLKRLL